MAGRLLLLADGSTFSPILRIFELFVLGRVLSLHDKRAVFVVLEFLWVGARA